jgi:4-hydroxybenzoyl-CoA thioesterase
MTYLVNRRQIMIEWGQCDPVGFVHNNCFFEVFDTSTWLLFQVALGVRPPDLPAAYDIIGIPLVGAGARYLHAPRFGDLVEIDSSISEFRRSSFSVQHQLMIEGTLAVEGTETRVWAAVDQDDPKKMKARPIPPEVIERFKAA